MTQLTPKSAEYGKGSATYEAVGGLQGLQKLVTEFYRVMHESPAYSDIRDMHPKSLELSIDKLVSFLSGWMGGEALYLKKYGGGGMPKVHMHLNIGTAERDMWLSCMHEALSQQSYPKSLIDYLMVQFSFPAERIHQVSQSIHHDKN
ncbi:MAG: hemoglobin [Cocleimonas sp.]|jgi:hemoglobin